MTRSLLIAFTAALALAAATSAPGAAQTKLRVGWCAKTVTSAASPFAIANKMGWFKKAGFEVELVPLAGSTDCVRYVGTGELRYALPSVEPLASFRPQGLLAKVFYTAYQGNIYGFAVAADSPIRSLAKDEIKGKRIGVQSMASAGLPVARALVASLGLDPASDVNIVVVGEGAQATALLRAKQVDLLSLYDVQYALIENAGLPLRRLPAEAIDRFPSNGFIALDDTLKTHRAEAVALAQGYAKGTIFAIDNPEAAVRILWEEFPQTKSTGKSEDQALKDDVKTLEARIVNWRLQKSGVTRWGENAMANYDAYLAFLLKQGVIQQKVSASDVVTNDLIADINDFDPDKVATAAEAYGTAAR
ncbi:MAG TPA: ABC transporter substrate-binding protein [Stellaceae bacterium]|jgi:NitT/TauT family transport system substrate-binding protein|nr:ABC transporter substrate-binding protein [Stellaceae bacterium]